MLDVVTVPLAVFGALVGNAMVDYNDLTFRVNFIVGVVLNILTMITTYLWYYPVSLPMPSCRAAIKEISH